MMIVAPNSLVRQEVAQGGEEEETGGRRKAGSIGTPTLGADAPTGPTQSGVSDARNRRKHGRWSGVHSTGEVEGAYRDQPYPLTIGMEGATE